MVAPKSFRVRMYNVGFGDSFLLTFDYGEATANQPRNDDGTKVRFRHVLFDHGSTSRARTQLRLASIAAQIAKDTAGQLDALVVSHRHRDHLSGFGTAAGAALLALKPKLVIRSWTEDPDLQKDAGKTGSVPPAGPGIAQAKGTAAKNARYLATIAAGQELVAGIARRAAGARKVRTALAEAAEDELANADAINALNLAAAKPAGEYLYARRDGNGTYRTTRLAALLPGVDVHLLGPPRPSDWPEVVAQADDSSEFWLGAPRQIERLYDQPAAARAAHLPPLGTSRWIVDRLRRDEPRQLTGLVRWLDNALNNTSIILLFAVGQHRLLFGGDAQIENWSWALKQAEDDERVANLLADVTVYKVGHHGSRNATPRSLVRLWNRHKSSDRPFVAMMSTKAGVHGEGAHAVPRTTLITALRERGTVLSTDEGDIPDWIEVSAAAQQRSIQVSSGDIS